MNKFGPLVADNGKDISPGVYNTRTENSRDDWETPDWLFQILNREFHFTLDLAASDHNTKCNKYFTKDDNALKQDITDEIVFCNPPFFLKDQFVQYAVEYSKTNTIVMILPVATSTKLFHQHVIKAAEIRFIEGRVNYCLNGREIKGSNFDSMVAVFKNHNRSFPQIRTLSRNENDNQKLDQFILSDSRLKDDTDYVASLELQIIELMGEVECTRAENIDKILMIKGPQEWVDCMMLFTSDPPNKMLQQLSMWMRSECPYCKREYNTSEINPIREICKRKKQLQSRRSGK